MLAGGLGTRIRSVGGMTPKVLLPVAGRPFLAHLLDYLARQGVTEAVLCLGHAADAVAAAAREHRPDGLDLVESRETAAMGTGGAIRDALDRLGGTFYIVNGDTYLDAPLPRLLDFHRSTGAALTLSLVRSPQAAEKGTVRVAPGGRVLEFAEKTPEGTRPHQRRGLRRRGRPLRGGAAGGTLLARARYHPRGAASRDDGDGARRRGALRGHRPARGLPARA